jgi:heme-degrading monooxygenase HmoA
VIHQLRIYHLTEEGKTGFEARFRDHATRIMRRYGFSILGAWQGIGAEESEFLYLLEWTDEAAMKRGWDGFLADEEWLAIRSSAKLVDGTEDRFLQPLELSSSP